jgi:hypothetical protein
MRIPGSSCLLQESWQVSSVLGREKVATPGEQATDAHRILRHFIAPHGAIALFDPPANGTRAAIIGAIERFSLGSFPLAIARQAMTEIPAIQKQEAETIRQALVLSLVRRHGF